MSHFVKFDPTTGRILFSGTVPDSMLSAQGENVIEGVGDSTTHYVENGALVKKPARPSALHVFDYAEKTWALDTPAACTAVRAERERRLAASDWTQLPDIPDVQKAAWASYRQALRDITEQPGFPVDVRWPDKPSN